MAKITFIDPAGAFHAIDILDGTSLMQGAVSHNVPGIAAECGGHLTCGTCRVDVPPEWLDKTGVRSKLEQQILSFSDHPSDCARLCCQIVATPELDGLCVTVPGV